MRKRDFKRAVALGRKLIEEKCLNSPEEIKLYGFSLDQLALKAKSPATARKLRQEAEVIFRKLSRYGGKEKDAYLGLGTLNLHRNNLKGALKFFQKAAKIVPKDPSAQISLGNVRRAIKMYRRAIAHYKKALGYKETKLPAIVNITLTFRDAGSTREASFWAKKGLEEMKKTRAKWIKPFRSELRKLSLTRPDAL